MTLREDALQHAGRGWQILPIYHVVNGRCGCENPECDNPGKHARIKWGKGATSDTDRIEKWWRWWPDANIGIATGQRSRGLVVVDLDNANAARAFLQRFPHAPMTRMASTGREGGGVHLYYYAPREIGNSSGDGLDFRGDGGMVVAPHSLHRTGVRYEWREDILPAVLPDDMTEWFAARNGRQRRPAVVLGERPAWLPQVPDFVARATRGIGYEPATVDDVREALRLIPNDDRGWDDWNKYAMAAWASLNGDEAGIALLDKWSRKSKKYDPEYAERRWHEIGSCPPTDLSFGTLYFAARLVDPTWVPPSRRASVTAVIPQAAPSATSDYADGTANGFHANGQAGIFPQETSQETASNPLIRLNDRYSVIGDIGGKCLVLSWVPSKVDDAVKVPSFQSFKSFSERYANQYVKIGKGDDEKIVQLGLYWLKWPHRKSYEGIDLIPKDERVLTGNVLNLWSGFAVEPARGEWPLMRQHIGQVLAGGDRDAAWYITKFAAWAVQHPGERAEVALVFRGGKGSGKGTFANALRRVFGQHGLQIFNSKHLVGAFNGHLRNCLLLFADEAFWAGDKQGESVLKGLITEQALMIEQKGVDAAPWRNRLHVIMAANADWVVPASHDERRYAVLDVSADRIGDRAYFDALHREMRAGGLAAMLWDLQRLDLGAWHPREIVRTAALQRQKELSLPPLRAWWEHLLQEARLPHVAGHPARVKASAILTALREDYGAMRESNPNALGRFLRACGCEGSHERDGNIWHFPDLKSARQAWEAKCGMWQWRSQATEWTRRE